jgi:hypothetical protein
MRGVDQADVDTLRPPSREAIERDVSVPVYEIGSAEYRESLRRECGSRRTLFEKVRDALRRAWYGPDPGPLTDAEMAMIMCVPDADDRPELVPPDDPDRLAWEAELRAIGVTPARKWSAPAGKPVRRLGFWGRIKYRVSLGW